MSTFEQEMLAHALMFLGGLHANAERWEDAEHALARSRGIYEQLIRNDPMDSDAKGNLADLLDMYTEMYNELGKEALARDALDEACSLRKQIDDPADPAPE